MTSKKNRGKHIAQKQSDGGRQKNVTPSEDIKQPRILGRDDILSVDDVDIIEVEIPEWGGSVNIREMTGADRDAIESLLFDESGNQRQVKNFRGIVVSMSVVDSDGNRIFGEDDIETLEQKSAAALNRIFLAALELNAMTASSAKAIEKN